MKKTEELAKELAQNSSTLEELNTVMRSLMKSALERMLKLLKSLAASSTPDRSLKILDFAAGGGDLAIRLSNLAQRDGVSLKIDCCDIRPTVLQFATDQAAASKRDDIRFFQCDALNEPFPQLNYDVVMCSLFLHHLDEGDAIRLLQRMKKTATQLILVDDLRRTRFGYWLAWLGCRILTRCHVVHFDESMACRRSR